MANKRKILKFTQGNEFEWIASVLREWSNTISMNLPNHTDDEVDYYQQEATVVYIEMLAAKITSKKQRKTLTTKDWENICLYLHQEVAD